MEGCLRIAIFVYEDHTAKLASLFYIMSRLTESKAFTEQRSRTSSRHECECVATNKRGESRLDDSTLTFAFAYTDSQYSYGLFDPSSWTYAVVVL
jgi:hypothetical protein